MSQKQKKGVTFADRHGESKKATPVDGDIEQGRRRSLATDGPTAATEFALPKPDVHRQPNQIFGVLSYCAPEGARVRCKKVAIKLSGVFASLEEAKKTAEIIRNEDPRFDVHVIPLYEWGMIPISEDVKPLIQKEYTDKYMTKVMSGLQMSMMQSRKEMDERIARDRAKSEMEMRKKLGPDYVAPQKKPEMVKEYEEETMKREDRAKDMTFTQRELIESFAKYMSSGCGGSGEKLDPSTVGNFIRFMEAQKAAEKTFAEADAKGESVDKVAIVVGNAEEDDQTHAAPPPGNAHWVDEPPAAATP